MKLRQALKIYGIYMGFKAAKKDLDGKYRDTYPYINDKGYCCWQDQFGGKYEVKRVSSHFAKALTTIRKYMLCSDSNR